MEPTNMKITFADQSVQRPCGVVEDIMVKIGKFLVPCDFVVFNMKKKADVPLILGRPFLTIAGIKFDFKQALVEVMVNDETIVFNCSKARKYPSELLSVGSIEVNYEDTIEQCTNESVHAMLAEMH